MKFFLKYSILFFAILHVADVWAQAQVKARVDAQKIVIGDQFHLFLEANLNREDGKLHWPQSFSFVGFEVVDTGRLDSLIDGKNILYKQKIKLTGFDSGNFIIPPIAFEVTKQDGSVQEFDTDSFQVAVNTVPVDIQVPFKSEKDIELVRPSWWYYWPRYVLALAIIALFFGIYFLWKKRSKRNSKPKVMELPYQKSLRLLNEIHKEEYVGESGEKQYYSAITDILKDYLEQQFGLTLSELTTDELLQISKKDRRLIAIRQEMKLIFQTADLAKFAKARPGLEAQNRIWNAAFTVIQKTKEMPQEGNVA